MGGRSLQNPKKKPNFNGNTHVTLNPKPFYSAGSRERLSNPNFLQLYIVEPSSGFNPGLRNASSLKRGIACYNSTGAWSKTLWPVIWSSRFRRASIDLTAIVRHNPSARLSLYPSCVQSHRPSLNRPCCHRPGIKLTKCVFYKLFVDWATDSGRARNRAWSWRWSSKTGLICWWSCPPNTINWPCSWSRRWSPLALSSWWCLSWSSLADMKRT